MSMLVCCGCGKKFQKEEVEVFTVPFWVCVVTHQVRKGDAILAVCRECLDKRGKPMRMFYSRVEWENGDWTYI